MSPPTTLSKPATVRRARYAVQAFALLFAATACCAFVGILGDRFPQRFDLTATREHHLSDRTTELLRSLSGKYELVVAANFSTLDQRAVARTQDLLDNFSRASPIVQMTIIDVASPRGIADLDALLRRLIDRFKPDLDKQKSGLEQAMRETGQVIPALTALSTDLLETEKTIKDGDPSAPELHKFFQTAIGACGRCASDLGDARTAAGSLETRTIGSTPVPATEDAVALLRKPLSDTLANIGAVADNLDAVSRSTDEKAISAATRERSKSPAAAAARARRQAGEVLAAIDELPRTPIAPVLRVLERSSAAIVIGPPGSARAGVTSIELSSIYPPRPPEGAQPQQIDLRARTEELFAGAIQSLARADAPIVVFVHADGRRMAPYYGPVATIADRLHLRGVDFAEWAVGLDTDSPSLKTLDPDAKRPAVYIVISASPDKPEDAARYGRLVSAVEQLLKNGKQVLVCEVPSIMPSQGQKDPMADVLTPLGVNVDTGRPLLRQLQGPHGRIVTADLVLGDSGGDHPISTAIRGLALDFPWAVPVRVASGAAGVQPIIMIDNQGKTVWAESEWLGFKQVPVDQQPLLLNPPAPDSSRDDTAGPWPLAVAIERTIANTNQRIVVVGCNKWLSIETIGAETEVEGRRVLRFPGNLELLDACVYWLAGQDSMISASPEARAAPLIPPLSDAQLSALRWGLIAGLPVAILLLGALWRLARG